METGQPQNRGKLLCQTQARASQVPLVVKNLPANAGDVKGLGSITGSGRSWQPTPVFLPGESHGQRSLVGYSPWGRIESDKTEHACAVGHTPKRKIAG